MAYILNGDGDNYDESLLTKLKNGLTNTIQNVAPVVNTVAQAIAKQAQNYTPSTIAQQTQNYTPSTTPTQQPTLKAAVQQQPSYTPVSYTPVTDNSGMINSEYASLISALKAKIQQSMNDKQNQINGLGQKYQPQKNQSEVQRNADLRSILEQNANAGDRGGIGRQNALVNQTAADNRLNAIDLQQQGEAASLKNDIANLVADGNIQEATYQAQKLKDLIADKQYTDEQNYNRQLQADNTNYTRSRDAVSDSRYNQEYADQRGDVAYNRQYQEGRDKVSDSRYNNEWQNTLKQQDFNNNMEEKKFNWDTDTKNNPSLLGQAIQNQTNIAQYREWQQQAPYRLQSLQNEIAAAKDTNTLNKLKIEAQQLENQTSALNLKNASVTAQQQAAKVKAEISNIYNQISVRERNLSLQKQKTNQTTSKTDLKPYRSYIEKYYTQNVYGGEYGDKQTGVSLNAKAAAQYIINTNLSDVDKQQLLSTYGLPTDPATLKKLLGGK